MYILLFFLNYYYYYYMNNLLFMVNVGWSLVEGIDVTIY
jgi:hypothetical protein